jgi:hypothetical protein
VVVVVDGVITIQGDGKTVHKAKDHSRAIFSQRKLFQPKVENFPGVE